LIVRTIRERIFAARRVGFPQNKRAFMPRKKSKAPQLSFFTDAGLAWGEKTGKLNVKLK
jgi:hypothetical protein